MRRVIIGGLAVVALAGVACGGSPTVTKTVTVAPPTAAAPAPSSQADALRQAIIQQGIPWTPSSNDADVDQGAEGVCSTLRQYSPIDQYELTMLVGQAEKATGLGAEDAARLLGSISGIYCPDVQLQQGIGSGTTT